jgi:Phosphotransferase enzyme family
MSNPVLALDEITPEWLSILLQHEVSSVTATPIGTGQVGATYRLTLTGTDVPKSIIAKLPSNDELSRTTGKSHLTYLRESRFYQQFAGQRQMAVPEHLYIAFDEDSHDFTLIMHDLPGHRPGNQLIEPTREEALLAMDAAASIHAGWWGDPMLDTLDWPNGTKAVPPALDVDALYAMFWPAFCDRYGERINADMKMVGEQFLGRVGANSAAMQSPRCLTHNDYRPDNMLFDLANTTKPIIIVDWQTTGIGVGASDIAYFTGTAFDAENRLALEPELLVAYKNALIKHGVSAADLGNLEEDYARSAVSGFLMGVTASMVVEQTERGDAMFLAMASRSASMVLDHRELAMPD